jgi:hypothetical protein
VHKDSRGWYRGNGRPRAGWFIKALMYSVAILIGVAGGGFFTGLMRDPYTYNRRASSRRTHEAIRELMLKYNFTVRDGMITGGAIGAISLAVALRRFRREEQRFHPDDAGDDEGASPQQ